MNGLWWRLEGTRCQALANAGEDAAVVLADVKKGKGTYGYNAATGEYGDLIDMGM